VAGGRHYRRWWGHRPRRMTGNRRTEYRNAPGGRKGKPSHGLRRYGAIGSDRRGAWPQRGGAIPIALADQRRSRRHAREGVSNPRPCTDRESRPAVSCFSRACLLARRWSDPCVAPSPLERVSSEKVRPPVPNFSGEPCFSGPNTSFSGVFVVWGFSGICGPPSRNAGSRRGAGRHRTGSDRPEPLITTAPRGRATRPAPPCSRRC
jgi:hypothetical protein